MGGKLIRWTKARSTSSCGQSCMRSAACQSFNFQRVTKKCYLFSDADASLSSKKDGRYNSGFRDCTASSTAAVRRHA